MSDHLRPYQETVLNNIFNNFDNNTSVLLQMPTGTGKTSVFCVLIKKWIKEYYPNKRVLILVHRKELVDQIITRLKTYGIIAARIQSGHKTELTKQVQVGLIQSLKKPEKLPKNLSLIVIDEAHHTPSNSYRELLKHYEKHSPKILGVTATPCRINGSGFDDLFDKLIVSDSIIDFINNGYLSPIKHLATSIPDLSTIKIDYRRNDFDEKELEKIMRSEQIMAELIQSYITYGENKKAIVFAINKAHSKDIVERFNNEGINAVYIDSDTNKEDRELIVKEFKEGKYQILCNVNIFTEGFDCPDVEVVQLARPTKSLALYLQQVGRCMRPLPGKEYGLILDNACLWETHGLISSDFEWSLSKPVKIKKGKSKVSKKNKKAAFEFIAHEMLGLELEEIEILTPENEINGDYLLPYYEEIPPINLLFGVKSGCYEYVDLEIDNHLLYELNEEHQTNFKINRDLIVTSSTFQFGIFDTLKNQIVLNIEFDNIGKPDVYGRSLIEKNGLLGLFCCNTREILVPPIYNTLDKLYSETNNSSLFKVSKNNCYGIVCNQEVILNCEYDQILIDYNSLPYLLNVRKENKWFLFKESGNKYELTNIEFIFNESFGRNLIKIDNVYGVLDISGLFLEFPVIIQDFKLVHDFLLIKYFYHWIIWDSDFDNMIINKLFEDINFVTEKIFIAKLNGKFGVQDTQNEIILDFIFESIELIYPNVFLARNENLWKVFDGNNLVFENVKKKYVIASFQTKINSKNEIEWLSNSSFIRKENELWRIYKNNILLFEGKIKKEVVRQFRIEDKIEKSIVRTKKNNGLSISKIDSKRIDFIKKEFILMETTNYDNMKKIRDLYKELRISKSFIEAIISTTHYKIDLNPNTKISDEFYNLIEKIIEYDKIDNTSIN